MNRIQDDNLYDIYYNEYINHDTRNHIDVYCPSCNASRAIDLSKDYIKSQRKCRQKDRFPFNSCPVDKQCKNKVKNLFIYLRGKKVRFIDAMDKIIDDSIIEQKAHQKQARLDFKKDSIL